MFVAVVACSFGAASVSAVSGHIGLIGDSMLAILMTGRAALLAAAVTGDKGANLESYLKLGARHWER